MTKDKAVLNAAYQAASNQIIEQLEQGKDVACLTLGDPTIYSTYIYIHRIVKAHGYATARYVMSRGSPGPTPTPYKVPFIINISFL